MPAPLRTAGPGVIGATGAGPIVIGSVNANLSQHEMATKALATADVTVVIDLPATDG